MTDLIAAVAAGHAQVKMLEAEYARLQAASGDARDGLNAARDGLEKAESRLMEAARAYKAPQAAPQAAPPAVPATPPPAEKNHARRQQGGPRLSGPSPAGQV